ncbi:MAG: hypothetical protein A3F68_00090 [Acidobacteria bacterium RIFCSPLOWO2_12_FULL_54_10]|nr:MAG: hypothetical protein A3F68_00090 [Acidobacteria bacterium RIFCSPLOWO2_12_FULL_54_10]
MNDSNDDALWGMTGAVLRRLDAKVKPKKAAPAAEKDADSQADDVKKSFPAISFIKSPQEINSLHKLAYNYHAQKKYADAERVYREVLLRLEDAQGPMREELARLLNNLARLYQEQEKYAEAEPLYHRSLAIAEECYGKEHPKVARRLVNLAELCFVLGRRAEADDSYKRALAIVEKEYGPKHPDTLKIARGFAAVLRKMNRSARAEALEVRFKISRVIYERRTGKLRRSLERRNNLKKKPVRDNRQPRKRRASPTRRYSENLTTIWRGGQDAI